MCPAKKDVELRMRYVVLFKIIRFSKKGAQLRKIFHWNRVLYEIVKIDDRGDFYGNSLMFKEKCRLILQILI